MPPWELILGSAGVAVVGVVATVVLWREREAALKRERESEKERRLEERAGRLEAERRLDEALEVSKQATELAAQYERLVRERL